MDKNTRLKSLPCFTGNLLDHCLRAGTCLVWAILATGYSPLAAQTEVTTPAGTQAVELRTATPDPDSVQYVMNQGLELETAGRWGEALSVYQKALKKEPRNPELRKRRTVARIHYGVERRYSDSSFLKTISETGGTKSLNVYAEVLLKIQSYYVENPNWSLLTHYGLKSVDVALTSPEFRGTNLPRVTDEQIHAAVRAAQQELAKYKVKNRHDAYLVASATAKQLNQHLGLATQATIYEFVCGAIAALDPYSAFMSSNQYSETMSQIEGNFVGLGVELRTHREDLEIVSVIPGGSAGLGGILEGDRITRVDQQSVAEAGSERAADMLRGVEGSFVELTVQRGSAAPIELRLQRRRVEIPSVDRVRIVDRDKAVGYIRLTNFQKTTVRDFDAALWKLHRDGMRSLIVDVRGNPGGLLSASVEIADRFIGKGVIVSTRGRNPIEDFTHRAEVANTWRVPLVVLIDENSASASEIFAAAIRDHRRGTIVGHQSYGKGSVQGIFPLNVSGGGVRLTTAKFFSPNGQPISQVGVRADIEVQNLAKSSPSSDDPEDAALRIGIQTAHRAAQLRNANLRQQRTSQSQTSFRPFPGQ